MTLLRFSFLTLFLFAFSTEIHAFKKKDKNLGLNKGPELEMPKGALMLSAQKAYLPQGCGKRKALGGMVSVYEICMNINGGKASQWQAAFAESSAHSFMLSLKFLRGVGGAKVSSSFKKALAKTATKNPEDSSERVRFLEQVKNLAVKKGDVIHIYFNAKGASVFRMLYKGKKGVVDFSSPQKDFARAIAQIWLGPKNISAEIKKALLRDK